MNSLKNIFKSGIIFIGLLLMIYSSSGNPTTTINIQNTDKHGMSQREKLKDLHYRFVNQLIKALELALDGQQNLADELYQDALRQREVIDQLLEDHETVLLFKTKIDEITLKKYPQCSNEQMKQHRGQYSKIIDCLEVSKSVGIEAIDALVFENQKMGIIYHDNLDSLRKDSFIIIDDGDTIIVL